MKQPRKKHTREYEAKRKDRGREEARPWNCLGDRIPVGITIIGSSTMCAHRFVECTRSATSLLFRFRSLPAVSAVSHTPALEGL
jgi:hypothetical protein